MVCTKVSVLNFFKGLSIDKLKCSMLFCIFKVISIGSNTMWTSCFGVKCAAPRILKARILCLKLLKMDSYKNVLEI